MSVESPWPLIEKRFPSGQYALLQEVRDAAGFGASRSADGIAMSLWPSRGLLVEGIEVKSYRSDWLRELKNPKKAENIFKYCDKWWLITAEESVAKLEEIPATWGWLSVKGKRICTMKEAPRLKPIPLDKSFIACMLKRATEGMVPIGSIQDKIDEAKKSGEENCRTNDAYEVKSLKEEVAELKSMISTFEETSGIKFGRYDNPKKIGDAVKFILNGGLPSVLRQVKLVQGSFSNLHRMMNNAVVSIAPILEEHKVDSQLE